MTAALANPVADPITTATSPVATVRLLGIVLSFASRAVFDAARAPSSGWREKIRLVRVDPRRELAVEQYAASTANLDARAALHARFSTATQAWHEWVYDRIGLRNGESVVEVGAGTGLLWTANLQRVPPAVRLMLSDFSMAMCRRLRAELPARMSLVCADAQWLPVGDDTADVVIANQMLYHVPDQLAALREMHRVLKPNGRAVIATNGSAHMGELRDLLAEVGIADPTADPMHASFLLEDAPAVVSAVFPRVNVEHFDDGLLVTEQEPLIAYIESFAPVTAAQRGELQAVIAARLQQGPIAITKVAGVLIAHPA